jgi:hypothetical protein
MLRTLAWEASMSWCWTVYPTLARCLANRRGAAAARIQLRTYVHVMLSRWGCSAHAYRPYRIFLHMFVNKFGLISFILRYSFLKQRSDIYIYHVSMHLQRKYTRAARAQLYIYIYPIYHVHLETARALRWQGSLTSEQDGRVGSVVWMRAWS